MIRRAAHCLFAAAFVPVLFGTFLRDTPAVAAIAAAVTAVTVHYGVYATGQWYLPYFADVSVKNPGISTALAVVAATAVGGLLYLWRRPTSPAGAE